MTETKQAPKQDNRRNSFHKGPQGQRPKGKKPFKRFGGKPSLPPAKRGEPVYQYISECHDAPSSKAPCERKPDDRAEKKFSEASLGSWRCSVCKHPCKVRRRKNKPEEVTTATE